MLRCNAAVLVLVGSLAAAESVDWITAAGGTAKVDKAGRITAVDLRSSWVTDSDMQLLAQLSHLSSLDLSMTRITDRGLQQLKSAPAITELNLYYAEQITDEGLAAIKGWKHLKKLNVRGTRMTDATLEHAASVPTLEVLDVGYAQVTDVGLDHLGALTNLKELALGGNKLTDAGLQSIRHLTALTRLDLAGSQRTDSGLWSVSLTDAGIGAIATLRTLRHLRLDGMPVSGRSLEKLKTLTNLERLSLQGCKRVGDDAVAVIASSWPGLKAVDLKGTAVSADAVAGLRKSKPALQIFSGDWGSSGIAARGD